MIPFPVSKEIIHQILKMFKSTEVILLLFWHDVCVGRGDAFSSIKFCPKPVHLTENHKKKMLSEAIIPFSASSLGLTGLLFLVCF